MRERGLAGGSCGSPTTRAGAKESRTAAVEYPSTVTFSAMDGDTRKILSYSDYGFTLFPLCISYYFTILLFLQ